MLKVTEKPVNCYDYLTCIYSLNAGGVVNTNYRRIRNLYGFEIPTFEIRGGFLACINLLFMRLNVRSMDLFYVHTNRIYQMANKLRNIVLCGFVHLDPPE